MKLLYIIDPLSQLSVSKDTSFAFMEATLARGHEVWTCRIGDLIARDGRGLATARPARVFRPAEVGPHWEWLDDARLCSLEDFDVVLMRKDPPFDMEFIFATYILDLAGPRTRVVNSPEGLRSCNEKAYIMRFPSVIPSSVISRNRNQLRAFLAEHGRAVFKPLDGKGGEGIVLLEQGDLNTNSILDLLTLHGKRTIMAQRYVPEARQGDKRILLVDGEPLAAFARIPANDDLRGNMCAGATVAPAPITDRDREVCDLLGPRLVADGHRFVGIDMLGPWLTEINVTSPTGVQEAKRLAGVDVADALIAAFENGDP